MSGEDEVLVECVLLQALKQVADPKLRGEIEEALKQARGRTETKEDGAIEGIDSEGTCDEGEGVEDSKEMDPEDVSVEELQKKMSELKRLRESIRGAKEG